MYDLLAKSLILLGFYLLAQGMHYIRCSQPNLKRGNIMSCGYFSTGTGLWVVYVINQLGERIPVKTLRSEQEAALYLKSDETGYFK